MKDLKYIVLFPVFACLAVHIYLQVNANDLQPQDETEIHKEEEIDPKVVSFEMTVYGSNAQYYDDFTSIECQMPGTIKVDEVGAITLDVKGFGYGIMFIPDQIEMSSCCIQFVGKWGEDNMTVKIDPSAQLVIWILTTKSEEEKVWMWTDASVIKPNTMQI